jgi:hypothetical protein
LGVVLMSKRELNRIDVRARLDAGRLTSLAAADLMRVTVRLCEVTFPLEHPLKRRDVGFRSQAIQCELDISPVFAKQGQFKDDRRRGGSQGDTRRRPEDHSRATRTSTITRRRVF